MPRSDMSGSTVICNMFCKITGQLYTKNRLDLIFVKTYSTAPYFKALILLKQNLQVVF